MYVSKELATKEATNDFHWLSIDFVFGIFQSHFGRGFWVGGERAYEGGSPVPPHPFGGRKSEKKEYITLKTDDNL